MFQKILCPVDFSDDSINAAEYSNELCILSGAELILIHIKNLMAVSQGRLPMEGGDLVSDVENLAKDEMSKLVARLTQKNNSGKIRSFLKAGINTGDSLISFLSEQKPDLLVMYTDGISGLGDFLTGTKTDKIIDKTSVPLLLIPGTFKFSPIKSIVFSTDNKGDENKNLSLVAEFANLLKAHIYILHITGLANSKIEFNKSLSLENYADVSYETHENKNVIKGIQEFADSKDCGFIVMNTYTRSFFEKIISPSLTKNMAYNLQRPLLVLDKD